MNLKRGSGLHTVTPAHSLEDLKISEIYQLPKIGILCPYTGSITNSMYELEGLKPDDAKI